MMMKYFFWFLLFTTITACDTYKTYEHTYDTSKRVVQELENAYGFQPTINWKFHNDQLTQVSIMLDASDMNEIDVEGLRETIRGAIKTHFNQVPKDLLLVLRLD